MEYFFTINSGLYDSFAMRRPSCPISSSRLRIGNVAPRIFGKITVNNGIKPAYFRISLFYMQNGSIVINFFAKAEGFNLAVNADNAAAQL